MQLMGTSEAFPVQIPEIHGLQLQGYVGRMTWVTTEWERGRVCLDLWGPTFKPWPICSVGPGTCHLLIMLIFHTNVYLGLSRFCFLSQSRISIVWKALKSYDSKRNVIYSVDKIHWDSLRFTQILRVSDIFGCFGSTQGIALNISHDCPRGLAAWQRLHKCQHHHICCTGRSQISRLP